METTVITIIGIVIGFMQGIIIFLLSGIKKEIADLWERLNNHSHEVNCSGPDCRTLHTGNVIIPRGRT